MPSFSDETEQTIKSALGKAASYAVADTDHLLEALLEKAEIRTRLEAGDINAKDIQEAMAQGDRAVRVPAEAGKETVPSRQFQVVVQHAALSVQKDKRETVLLGDLFDALLASGDTVGVDHLRKRLKTAVARKGSVPSPSPKPSSGEARRPAMRTPGHDPMTAASRRLNGHMNYLDPAFGVSFPTACEPDPLAPLSWETNARRKAVQGLCRDICHYCGVRASKYMKVIGRRSAVSVSEMHLACIFCAQVTELDKVGSRRSGVLLHLPEFGQAELNAYAKVIYVCRISQGRNADLAREMLDVLMARRARAKAQFGSHDPVSLAARIAGCQTRAEREALDERLRGIRLFPLDRRIIREGNLKFNQFPQILAFWRSNKGPFGGLTPPQMRLTTMQAKLNQLLRAA